MQISHLITIYDFQIYSGRKLIYLPPNIKYHHGSSDNMFTMF